MSKRLAIMRLVERNPSITLDELVDLVEFERKHVQWTVNDCKADGLLEVMRDDVTGKPAYRVTDKGKAWLLNRPAQDQQEQCERTAQPAVAAGNTGSVASGSRKALLSTEGDAVADQAPRPNAKGPGIGPAAPTASVRDETHSPARFFYLFESEGFDTPQEALEAAFEEMLGSGDDYQRVRIVEFRTIGRIEVKPTLVPAP